MDLKNAGTVCLISLFAATLVVLIARALDLQAANRLEPQLAAIVEELQAIRGPDGLAVEGGVSRDPATPQDGLVVYYFHSSTRCPTCRAIESQARDVVQTEFASELQRGELQWKVVNYEQPSAAELANKFEIQMPVVVLAKVSAGEILDWKSLDRVWALVDDQPAYAEFVAGEIQNMLEGAQAADTQPPAEPPQEGDGHAAGPDDSAAPPAVPDDLPIPE
jgi:thiol-disulfide isomerase/thioredoxin